MYHASFTSKLSPVWPDLAQFLHFGKYLKIFGNILRVYLVFGKVLNSLWHNLYAGAIAVNGQILKTQSSHLITLAIAFKISWICFSLWKNSLFYLMQNCVWQHTLKWKTFPLQIVNGKKIKFTTTKFALKSQIEFVRGRRPKKVKSRSLLSHSNYHVITSF